jgi:hypothetical protein
VVQGALSVDIEVDKADLEDFVSPNGYKWKCCISFSSAGNDTYILDSTLLTAVDVTARAVNTEGTGEDVAQGQDTTVAVVLANNLLVAGALGATRAGDGEGSKAEGSEDGLDEHVCGIWEMLDCD